MPPGVAPLNYISCGILWRIFSPTGTFRGLSSTYHKFRRKDQRSCYERGGGHYTVFHKLGAQREETPSSSYCDFLRFFFYIIRRSPQGSAKLRWAWRRGHNMINMTIRELYYTFEDFFPKLEYIFFGGEKNIFLRVQRSSEGCSVAQKGAA